MKILSRLLATIFLLSVSQIASAQLQISRSVIDFNANASVQDIEIINRGKDKLYLNLTIAEVLDPESEKPTRQPLDDPRTAPVLVNPRQLLLTPGQRKVVRVILREKAVDKDRIYRLAVKPYTGKVRLNSKVAGTKATGIKVLVGYDLLVISRPDDPQPNVVVSRSHDSVQFTNQGNTSVLLSNIEQCDNTDGSCVDLRPNRLYAGETYHLNLPKAGSPDRYPVKVIQVTANSGVSESY